MKRTPALAVVFAASAAVLVMEILANRLMAPYVGVSLETFTGIIGVVLAGLVQGRQTQLRHDRCDGAQDRSGGEVASGRQDDDGHRAVRE